MKIYPHYTPECFTNSYLIGNEKTKEALIIDPGRITGEVLHHIEKNHYSLRGICITHNHSNHHTYGLTTLLKIYDSPVYAGDGKLAGENGTVLHGDCTLTIAGFTVECLFVPGHSSDSYLFKIEHSVFTGDSITAGIAGKTLHSSAAQNLSNHLAKKLFTLDDSLLLFPGHGPPTTIGIERIFNTAFYPVP